MSEYAHCPDAEELAAWIDGEIDDATRRRIVAHLDTCERCTEVVEGVLAFQDEEALSEDGVGSDLDDEPAPREAEFTPRPPLEAFARRSKEYDDLEAPSRRWRPYFAVALAACAVVWAVRVGLPAKRGGQDQFAALDNLNETAKEISEKPVDRGGAPVPNPEHFTLCREYLRTSPVAAKRIQNCLLLTPSDLVLADLYVRDSRFSGWLADPSLHESACQALRKAWPSFTGSLQETWRSARDQCLDGQ